MTDKEWLAKITMAYKNYANQNKNVEEFISWLYKAYGIVEPKKD